MVRLHFVNKTVLALHNIRSKSALIAAATLCHFVTGAGGAAADTIDLEFVPPQIETAEICGSRSPDGLTIARWDEWDGQALPDLSSAEIRNDLARLRQIDPDHWLPTILLIVDKLEEADPRFAGNNALLARIDTLEAAGEYQELEQQQLVAQLSSAQGNLSAWQKNALSRYLRDGIGIERDAELANELLVDAAFAGNADALLTLARMELSGEQLPNWNVPIDLAVTMAFGALVGELDPQICSRAARIAREYHNGEIVTANTQLAHDWFRFAADLGDSESAWKIVEYHSRAEGFEKDNEVLLRYLTQAADAQLPYAQIELGKLYEAGSLIDRNLDAALSLYRAAAVTGLRPGLTRLAIFLEDHAENYPEFQGERIETLHRLVERDDTAGWVYTRLAEEILEEQGRWAGLPDAMVYLEQAAALGDVDGSLEFAKGLIAARDGQENFERAVDILSYSVSNSGNVTPTKLLFNAFMCNAPDSPRVNEANYWRLLETATGTQNVSLTPPEVISLSTEDNPLQIAQLQSHALFRRPQAMANYLKYLEENQNIGRDALAAWQERSGRATAVLERTAQINLELANTNEERLLAIELLREQYRASGGENALSLARVLLQANDLGVADQQEISALLSESAAEGSGQAMQLLQALDVSGTSSADVFAQFRQVIDANGDFDALLFAVPHLPADQQPDYLSRAAGIVPCDYKNVIRLSRTYFEIDDIDGALHWMGIAENLIDNNGWALTDLARTRMAHLGSSADVGALALFERARQLGDSAAWSEAFNLLVSDESDTYDPAHAAELVALATELADTDVLERLLGRYRAASKDTRDVIDGQLDMPQVFLVAAESGDPFAMRAYAQFRRETAAGAEDLAASTHWFEQAAILGDARSMEEYGYALAFGIGIEADTDGARQWLARAAEAGSERAMELILLINLSEET